MVQQNRVHSMALVIVVDLGQEAVKVVHIRPSPHSFFLGICEDHAIHTNLGAGLTRWNDGIMKTVVGPCCVPLGFGGTIGRAWNRRGQTVRNDVLLTRA